jgi:hypothetical protein
MFELAKYYEEYWKSRPQLHRRGFVRESFSLKPIPVKIDIENLKNTFVNEFTSSKEVMGHFLPKSILKDLENIVKNKKKFDSDLWSEVVFNYAAAYKNLKREPDKYLLLDSLKTLWIGRFISYAIETKNMDINEAENVLQKQAEVFEEKFNYLRSIY